MAVHAHLELVEGLDYSVHVAYILGLARDVSANERTESIRSTPASGPALGVGGAMVVIVVVSGGNVGRRERVARRWELQVETRVRRGLGRYMRPLREQQALNRWSLSQFYLNFSKSAIIYNTKDAKTMFP